MNDGVERTKTDYDTRDKPTLKDLFGIMRPSTDEERDAYERMMEKKSVNIGVNIFDTREKLEADVRQLAFDWSPDTTAEGNPEYELRAEIMRLLNRQAAIAEREIREREQYGEKVIMLQGVVDELHARLDCLEAHGVTISEPFHGGYEVYNEQKRRADELQAKVEMLQLALDHTPTERDCEICDRTTMLVNLEGLQSKVDELTAERDDALEIRDEALGDAATFKAERDHLKEVMDDWQAGTFYAKLCEARTERDRLQRVVMIQAESFKDMERELKEATDKLGARYDKG